MPRLVVLPPRDQEPAQSASAVASLLLEDVVIGLCSMKSISVVAPHTSWQLRGGLIEDDATLDRFHIGYVLQTALMSGGGGASRLIAKLYDTASRSILWAENFPLTADDSQNCYRSISVGIVLALADAIERNELARFDTEGNPTAYYWHLIGQKHLRGVDLPEARRAVKAFRSARRADPEFAPAYSGEARALQREWLLLARAEQDLLDKAEKVRTPRGRSRSSRRARFSRSGSLLSVQTPLRRKPCVLCAGRATQSPTRRHHRGLRRRPRPLRKPGGRARQDKASAGFEPNSARAILVGCGRHVFPAWPIPEGNQDRWQDGTPDCRAADRRCLLGTAWRQKEGREMCRNIP